MLLKSKALTLLVLAGIFLIAFGFFFPFGGSLHGMNPGYGYRWSGFISRPQTTALNISDTQAARPLAA